MRSLIRISHSHPRFNTLILSIRRESNFSRSDKTGRECERFLPWLQQKTGCKISEVLSVGVSSHGRSLFTSKSVQCGERLLKVPYNGQISTHKINQNVEPLLLDIDDNVSRLAVALLAEKKLRQDSEWAPYIESLPCISEMHNTMFWRDDELDMLKTSSIYQEIIDQRAHVKNEFLALKKVLDKHSKMFGEVSLDDFMHAYALVISRAWGTSKGISLIPFADFLNHDGASEADLLNDDISETSEVIADRDYASGEEVFIRYGKFPNAILVMDFGFTVPCNYDDQVKIWMNVPDHDPLYRSKVNLLHKHCLSTNLEGRPAKNSEKSFVIRKVKSPKGKGKGIPQALRAYARILSVTSLAELNALEMEATETDGRLARRPLKNIECENRAHHLLLLQFSHMVQNHAAAIKKLQGLGSTLSSDGITQSSLRRKMAVHLLNGELGVLKSASSWLTNYCASLPTSFIKNYTT